MCGIAGLITPHKDGSSLARVQQMTRCLDHRGPDDKGYWQNPGENVTLGHRRLSVIDLGPSGAQPMQYHDRYTIIYNGEIYNYLELRTTLQQQGYSFHSASDTEVILAAYALHGAGCVNHFDGMFAFAIWDEQMKQLFAARDRFGEKPFYYAMEGDTLLFASETKALFTAGFPRKPNLKMLFNFLTIGYTDNPEQPEETFYENVYRLPAATTMLYDATTGELKTDAFDNWPPDEPTLSITGEEAKEKFLHLFRQSVKRRLRSDVPVGTSLSGGLDSSAVAATVASLHTGDVHCFTAIFPGFEKDESVLAAETAKHFGFKAHTVAISADDLVRDWDKLVAAQEEPFGSASAYAQYRVFALARENNIKVLLDGQGADEILGGYSMYYKWYWQELFRKRKLLASKELHYAREMGIRERFGVRNVIAALFPDIASAVLEQRYLVHALQQEDLHRDFVRLQSREAYYSTPPTFDLKGALYFSCFEHGLEELLRLADRNSMAHGREVRLPFLEPELVRFVFSLPSQFKIRKGWTKWLLRSSMDGILPGSITWKKEKIGFEPPQKEWMQHPHLQQMIRAAKEKLVKENILNPSALDKPLHPKAAHEADNFDWRYLSAAAWLDGGKCG